MRIRIPLPQFLLPTLAFLGLLVLGILAIYWTLFVHVSIINDSHHTLYLVTPAPVDAGVRTSDWDMAPGTRRKKVFFCPEGAYYVYASTSPNHSNHILRGGASISGFMCHFQFEFHDDDSLTKKGECKL